MRVDLKVGMHIWFEP